MVFGAIAQLGERLHGMQEVRGSIPRSSTKITGTRPSGKNIPPGKVQLVLPLVPPLLPDTGFRNCDQPVAG